MNTEQPKKNFVVVNFTLDNSAEVVPRKWISDDGCKCFWPITGSSSASFRKLKENPLSSPLADWIQYDIKIIKSYGKLFKMALKFHCRVT
jgi:hypothetical protein